MEEDGIKPGIHFRGQQRIDLLAGDILFIAGNPPANRKIPFEHAAVVACGQVVESDQDLRMVEVIGLPESIPDSDGSPDLHEGLAYTPAGEWKYRPILESMRDEHGDTSLSSPERVWNLGARVFQEPEDGLNCVMKVLRDSKRKKFSYRNLPHIHDTFEDEEVNNCVGLVDWSPLF